jgi:hypothetical protein
MAPSSTYARCGSPRRLARRDDSLKSVIRTMSTVLEDATNGFTAGEGALMHELLVRLADES